MAAISKLAIINNALRELNVERISTLGDDCKQAEVMADIYDIARLEMMEENPWNFAIKRAVLAQDPTDPAFGWEAAFILPSDFVYAVAEYDENEFEVEGNLLLTNAEEIKLVYVSDMQDTSKYSPSFIKAFYLELAVRACFPLGQDKAHKQMLIVLAEAALSKARSFSAQQDDSDADIDPISIISTRLS
tara:strand:- start:695 stop:1261 length:567 start_codon:yes stop_codon:yes gene_type:complete